MLQHFGAWRALTVALVAVIGLGMLGGRAAPHAGLAAGDMRGVRGILGGPPDGPLSTIIWQLATYVGTANGNLAPAMHPTDPLRAVLGGPLPVRYTTDGGTSWQSAVVPAGLGPGVPVWIPGGNGQSALQISSAAGGTLQITRSTDSGANWSLFGTVAVPNVFETLPYLWADMNPASPYYGRSYLTVTMLDAAQMGSFDTVGLFFSTDQGATWSAPLGLVDPTEYAQGTNYNAFASAAVQPGGGVVVAWHRGQYSPTITNVPNKVMWSRSTDGGVTFPVSGTIATVPADQSVAYGSTSPGGFRWTPAPNIAADPADGTLYAAWIAYRQAGVAQSAATYVARSTDNGASWSAPVVVDDTQPGRYQFVPWVQVSPDHVVHVTYSAATTTVAVIAHFYVQSTDRGATWSGPFSLNIQGHINGAVQGDFQATNLGGYIGSQGTILTSWEEENGTGVRAGTFQIGGGSTPSPTPQTPSATPTALAPTASRTSTAPSTSTATPTGAGTATATSTAATSTATPTSTPTSAAQPSATPGSSTPTPTTCPIQFSDVPPGSTFYPFIHCLACLGIINGYPDGTFKPNNDVTRGQLSKIVSNSADFNDPQPNRMFQDVPLGSTFQVFIGRLASRGYINGYPCGGAGEPCVPPANLPYFRPNYNATRGQISKIDSNSAGFSDKPSGQQFEDVPVGSTYYTYTYRLVSRSIMRGYPCGGVNEACVPPGNLPYFRPNNNATRGQTSKIVSNTFFPDCNLQAR